MLFFWVTFHVDDCVLRSWRYAKWFTIVFHWPLSIIMYELIDNIHVAGQRTPLSLARRNWRLFAFWVFLAALCWTWSARLIDCSIVVWWIIVAKLIARINVQILQWSTISVVSVTSFYSWIEIEIFQTNLLFLIFFGRFF